MNAKNENFQKIGEGVVLGTQKSTRPPFRPNKFILEYRDIIFKRTSFATRFQRKEPALQQGFNAAIDNLIRGRGAEISSEMCDK